MNPAAAQATLEHLTGGPGSPELAGTLRLMALFTAMTLIPAFLILMTSFTRIVIVLSFVRYALGTPSIPPTPLIISLALILTGMTMSPTFQEAYDKGIDPYLTKKADMMPALTATVLPFRNFMYKHIRQSDLELFARASGQTELKSKEDLPITVIVSAFATSELKTAFEMGCMMFLAFLIIDVVVASLLMSMGMMMVPPMTISLPLKILVFVLADGWHLVIRSLLASFQ